MAENSTIEWTDNTFNPWEGCARVSPACENCYAETRDKRRLFGPELHWGVRAPRLFHGDAYWKQPLAWNRRAAEAGERRRVFCSSLADVFEDRRDLDPHRARLWRVIEATPNLDWLLLTKRPQNIGRLAAPWSAGSWPSNVWLGATVENQKYADERIPELLRHGAAVRFLSCEPLLGPLDLTRWLGRLAWVIAGGESGPGARPSAIDWIRAVRDQVVGAGVAFHFKQWGNWTPTGEQLVRLRTKSERRLDGRTWDEFPGPRMPASRVA
jgi:protein gp37